MYGEIVDLHISEPQDYPGSPFDGLIKQSFKNEDKNLHYLYVLDIGDEALLARVHLIRQAKKAIYIQTFIWSNDETGWFVAYELLDAARRGVKVKIIVDQWRLKGAERLAAFLSTAHPNIEVKNYNPAANRINPSAIQLMGELALKFKQVNQRMHNKIFIIDDRVCITGGRNYENDYYGRGERRNFKDRDVLVIGPVVNDITDSFMLYWASKLSVPSQDLLDVEDLVEKGEVTGPEEKDIMPLFAELDRDADSRDVIKKTFTDRVFDVNNLKFVFDAPGKNNNMSLSGGSVTAVELANFLGSAKEEIVVQTPYLVLDKVSFKNTQSLIRKNPGLDILISSNSLAATDSIYAYAFSYKQRKEFVKNLKFRIFEFKPVPGDIREMMPLYDERFEYHLDTQELLPSVSVMEEDANLTEVKGKHMCIHAKSFVLDGKSVWIGSFNVDPRSMHLNTEVGLIVYDENVAQAVRENILRDMAPQNSWTLGKRKFVPVISHFSGAISYVLGYIPVVDLWPFHYTADFELKMGKEEVPFYHEDFYENYVYVGSFPEVGLSLKEIQIRLLKTFAGFATPII